MSRRCSSIIAILAVEAFALILRAICEMRLQRAGHDPAFAHDVSYLFVPPLLAVLLAPVLRQCRRLLAGLFDPRRVLPGTVVRGFAVGVLARLAWWCSVVLRGVVGTNGAAGPGQFAMSWGCPTPASLLLAVLVWTCLIPVVEETLGRGLIQSLLEYRGRRFAIAASSIVFAVYHAPDAMIVALIMGVVLACLRANSGSLWPPIAAHAAYDGLTIVDWRCRYMHWQPASDGASLLVLAGPASIALMLLIGAIVFLVADARPGPRQAARASETSERVGNPLDDV
jgi:membrane protease YdiL (CAAX protease family)